MVAFFILIFRYVPHKSGLTDGWASHFSKNSYSSKYRSFRGYVSIPIKIHEPHEKTITYSLNAENGNVKVVLKRPDHTEHTIASVEEGTLEGSEDVRFPIRGRYRLRIVGAKTKGSFNVEWT
jgi:hypothetical protein